MLLQAVSHMQITQSVIVFSCSGSCPCITEKQRGRGGEEERGRGGEEKRRRGKGERREKERHRKRQQGKLKKREIAEEVGNVFFRRVLFFPIVFISWWCDYRQEKRPTLNQVETLESCA